MKTTVAVLMEMSAKELHSIDGVVELEDPENFTDDRMQTLRATYNSLNGAAPLDLNEVNLRLCCSKVQTTSQSRALSSASTTPLRPESREEQFYQSSIEGEQEAYLDLLHDGGRPSHNPEEWGRRILERPEDDDGIFSYLNTICTGGHYLLRTQEYFWKEFRGYQTQLRKEFHLENDFQNWVSAVNNERRERGLVGGTARLQMNARLQSAKDDWMERQHREYNELDVLVDKKQHHDTQVTDCLSTIDRLSAADAHGNQIQIEYAQEGLHSFRASARGAEADIKRQRFLLNWIDEQVSELESKFPDAPSCRQVKDSQAHNTPRESRRGGVPRKKHIERTMRRRKGKGQRIDKATKSHVVFPSKDQGKVSKKTRRAPQPRRSARIASLAKAISSASV